MLRFALPLIMLLLAISSAFASSPTRTIDIDGIPILLSDVYRPSPKPRGDFDTLTIPLRRVGNLWLIEAEIDSVRGNFILDLGAPYLVLNSTYFRDYEIDPNYTVATLNSNMGYVRQTRVEHFQVMSLFYKNLTADVTDLGNIENKRHVKILGLMGLNLFKEFVFDLNLREQQLTLYRNPEDFTPSKPILLETPFHMSGDHLIVQGRVNGKKLRLGLDTGAEMNMLDNKLSGKVFEHVEIQQSIEVSGANGSSSEVLVTVLKGLSVGEHEMQEMRTLVGSLRSMGKAYGAALDGMLGYPFFSQGQTVINFKKRKMTMYKWEDQP